MKLSDLQHHFQNALLENAQQNNFETRAESMIFEEVNISPKAGKEVLFGVYQDAYVLRLIEFLQTDYDVLEGYLGAAEFDMMARDYIKFHPSQNYNARWFGVQLPVFLAEHKPWSNLPELSELAAFDQALLTTFDGKNAPSFSLADMASIEDWGHLLLSPHPAVGRLNLKTNASDIREALREDKKPPEKMVLEQPEQWIFYRNDDLQAMYRLMAYDEAMMWGEMVKGADFGGLCEMLAQYHSEEEAPMQAAGYLQIWIKDGLLKRSS